jgi:tetratricopeptide (TPR) repeat protein
MFVLAAVCGVSVPAHADPLLGAEEVLVRISKMAGTDEKNSVPAKSEAERFMSDLEKFRTERASLLKEIALDRWLELYDRFRHLPVEAVGGAASPFALAPQGPSLMALVSSLPSPEAWEPLKHKLAGMPPSGDITQEMVLRAILAYLTKDKTALDKWLAELKASVSMAGSQRFGSGFMDLRFDLPQPGAGTSGVVTIESFETYLNSLKNERSKGQIRVLVPDLVALAGEKRAGEVLLKALSIPGVSLRVPSGGQTLDLAKFLATNRADLLTEPQWELVTGLNDTELYEAMSRRFPDKDAQSKLKPEIFQVVESENGYRETNTPRNEARVLYLLGLIGRNRIDDAVVTSSQLETDDFQSSTFERRWHSFNKYRYSKGLNQWCRDVLTARPELPLWKQCGLVATDSKAAEGLTRILDSAEQKQEMSLEGRLTVKARKVELLLAMDRTDEAVEQLRIIVTAEDSKESAQARQAVARIKLRMAPRLLTLGRLLSRPELKQEAEQQIIVLLTGAGRLSTTDMAGWEGRQALDELVDGYIGDGQLDKAEQVVLAIIKSTLNSPELNANPIAKDLALASGAITGQLTRLAQLYEKAGRHSDTLTMLERSRWWGATDLMDITDNTPSLQPIVAKALHKSGRDTEAVEILKWYLYAKPGDDTAYQTLIDITGTSVIPWLDQLQVRDQFEERPLIWKAVLLKQDGKLDEADTIVRQALKIDPTDGEEPPGDRVRGYAVLGEILKAKGKLEDSAFFERVIQSVRLAEQGDKLTEAGLLRRSLNVYEKASDQFADAYCVQWRLAERLASIGDLDGAKKHYEIAFERMPEQFGQVASVCFGCEGVFTHQQSVGVAEEVLTAAAKTSPNKPQVHYLLGQLREAQGRKTDAYSHFRRAAELDPGYLDAWKAVYALRNDVFLSQTEMDEIALRMVRLDPLNRHSKLNHGEISDVKALWAIYQEMGKERRPLIKKLFPLDASKQELEALVKKFGGGLEQLEAKRFFVNRGMDVPEPGDAVVRNKFVLKLLRVAGQNVGFDL